MASLMTNASAMTALQTLNTISKNMATTQNRISTGLRVAEASDNAAYWSIATSMKSDNKALSSVQDALGLGAGKIDTAYTGINEVIDTVDKIKQKLVTARGASQEDQQKIQSEIETLQAHIKSVVGNSNYAGSNIIQDNTDVNIVASYNRVGTTVTVDEVTLTGANVLVLDAAGTAGSAATVVASTFFDASGAAVTDTAIDTALGTVETALASLADQAAELGAAKSRVDLQKDFVSKLSDAIERGVGQLVDADMNEESARLSALQVQQQLGIQALSIANSNSQNILSLFR
ncbi:flagellin N-terminal helical domain-containing protein [Nitratireductor indicus]|uniref:flagellin N-terminal helical domain-containing protein n=1 Tax=Nitratireductor indicus TaxID=721133 RepID=UPI002874B1FE|nr:flagellin [Nitratireductor indicus]MDS1136101.1 flagellin [Nitratireductor indicus]